MKFSDLGIKGHYTNMIREKNGGKSMIDDNKDNKKIYFDGWFYINIPLEWEYAIEEDILDIYDELNGEGSLQISFLKLGESKSKLSEIVENQMSSFIKQFGIEILESTYKFSETSQFTVVSAIGKDEEDFIKIWVLAKDNKTLLITYISAVETEEINIVENIVNSIQFDGE